jgi:hypothetical protein
VSAPTTLPPEVQEIVDRLTRGPSILLGIPHPAINAAFDHGVIQVDGNALESRTQQWRTKYSLRKPAVT